MRLTGLLLTASLALATWAIPTLAHALQVSCSDDTGSCSVSNTPLDSFSCTCADQSFAGGSGTSNWTNFDEEMLMDACEAELEFCSFGDTDGATTGIGSTTSDDTSSTTGGDDTSSTTSGDDTSSTTSGDDTSSTTGGDDTTTSGDDTSSTTSGGDTDQATGTTGGATGADPTQGAGDESDTEDASAGADEDEDEDEDEELVERGSCSVTPGRPVGISMLLLGLLGFRRCR
ncbi:MAG: hypothetical protein AAGC53_20820 [Actinomycetota bacterium]